MERAVRRFAFGGPSAFVAARFGFPCEPIPALSRNTCGRWRFFLRQGPPFDLRLDELGDRFLIAVVKGLGVERALLRIDDVLGEFEHLAIDLQIRQLVEGFLRRAHFIVEVQCSADQAVAMRADQHCA